MGSVKIPLAGGGHTFVDARDVDLVSMYRWHCGGTNNAYAVAKSGGGEKAVTIYQHRLILMADVGEIVDHRNGDTRDNRRANLRIVTAAENAANRSETTCETNFRNVYPKSPNRYQALVTSDGARFRGPHRASPVAAAKDADVILRGLYGECASLNFPREGERGVQRPGADHE